MAAYQSGDLRDDGACAVGFSLPPNVSPINRKLSRNACEVSFKETRSGRATLGLDPQPVVDGMHKSLTRSKITLGRLDRAMSEQELDLFQFASSGMA
jgi:hypothetical protein